MSALLSTQFSSVLPAQKGGSENQINESWKIMFYLSYKGINSQNQWINGEGGGRRVQDGEHMYTCGGFILIFGKTNTIL